MPNPDLNFFPNGTVRSKSWYEEDMLHRTDGPAFIEYHDNGICKAEEWRIRDLLHRIDGPAYLGYDRFRYPTEESWYQNGLRHRIDGPATTLYFDGIAYDDWSLYGVTIVETTHAQLIKLEPLEILIQLFKISRAKHVAELIYPYNPTLSKNFLASTEL